MNQYSIELPCINDYVETPSFCGMSMTQFMWLENLLKISFTFDHKKDETEKVNDVTAELFSSIRFMPFEKRIVYRERRNFATSL